MWDPRHLELTRELARELSDEELEELSQEFDREWDEWVDAGCPIAPQDLRDLPEGEDVWE